jgi:hypothetical protein
VTYRDIDEDDAQIAAWERGRAARQRLEDRVEQCVVIVAMLAIAASIWRAGAVVSNSIDRLVRVEALVRNVPIPEEK